MSVGLRRRFCFTLRFHPAAGRLTYRRATVLADPRPSPCARGPTAADKLDPPQHDWGPGLGLGTWGGGGCGPQEHDTPLSAHSALSVCGLHRKCRAGHFTPL